MPVLKIKKDNQWVDVAYSGGSAISGSSLPPVTEADNGKILMVVDGAWQIVSLVMVEEEEF